MKINAVSSHAAIRSLLITMMCLGMFSFSVIPGGDYFTIYLNSTLVVSQHVASHKALKTLALDGNTADDVLKVHFSHCGKTGTARYLSIRNDQNTILKSWMFADQGQASMELKTGDVVSVLKQKRTGQWNLVYTSEEIPGGKVLAKLALSDGTRARL